MALLQINHLYFSYPTSQNPLFDDFSLQISEPWTTFAGSNGCGKSTLLNLICKSLTPDNGDIKFDGEIFYCPQETREIPENLYSDFWSDDNETRKFFSLLKITEDMLERYDTLSGGEKKRIQIACALAEKPSLLLLDEPTNHLDKASVQLILNALKAFDGMGIIVSHDRFFADSLCSRTLFLFNESKAFDGGRNCITYQSFNCGLTEAIQRRSSDMESSRSKWNSLNAKAGAEKERSKKLQQEIAASKSRMSKKNVDSSDHDLKRKIDVARISGKDRNVGDEKARLNSQIQQTEAERDSIKKALKRKEGFSLQGNNNARPVIIEECTIFADENDKENSYCIHTPYIEITQQSKIALTGQNGSGKTLFVRHIISHLEKTGRKDQVMYLPQEIPEEEKNLVLNKFNHLEEKERGDVLSTLFRLGSEPESLQGQNSAPSPGELRKLMIALAIQQPLSLLILDEPTNHMDITSTLALESALKEINCGLLIVSHDEAFLKNVTNTHFWLERDGNKGRLRKE